MSRIVSRVCSCLLVLCFCAISSAQSSTRPIEVTLCDLYQNPNQYAGKMVKVRGTIAGNDMWIDAFTTTPCSSWRSIVVVFPDRAKPAPDFDLVKDDSFKKFEEGIYHSRPIHIEATFEGRFDSAIALRDGKRTKIDGGYGKDHKYDGRIVLHRVSDVIVQALPSK